jgi:hypothetical protein
MTTASSTGVATASMQLRRRRAGADGTGRRPMDLYSELGDDTHTIASASTANTAL